MNANERRELILKKLHKDEKMDVELLAEDLNVSNMTIRRDLDYLEKQNKVIRTFGGAIPTSNIVSEASFRSKESTHNVEKKIVALKAVDEIKEHSTILLDSGTTTLEIAKLLTTRKNITVLTNDIQIASILMDSELNVIIIGGVLQNSTGAIIGTLTENLLRQFHVDIAFIGTHAVSLDNGIAVPSLEKAMLKRMMLEIAETKIVVVDSSKFNKTSLMEVCPLNKLDKIITDHTISDEQLAKYREFVTIER